MDAAFFLRIRTNFIRRYYATGIEPFREIQRKIGTGESPYGEPPMTFRAEDGEPAFLDAWIEADDGAQVVGRSAVSLLSDSIKLYFKALEQQLAFGLSKEQKVLASRKGFVAAYSVALGERLDTRWTDCPVRFDVIEQVVLARNRAQHGEHVSLLGVRHDPRTLRRHPDLIFANERELSLWAGDGAGAPAWLAPRLDITDDALAAAIAEIERLADWIDERIAATAPFRRA